MILTYDFSGGLIHVRDGANTQYVTSTAMVFSTYSDVLAKYNQKVTCGNQQYDAAHLMAFAKQQVLSLAIESNYLVLLEYIF
jgi:endoglucanase